MGIFNWFSDWFESHTLSESSGSDSASHGWGDPLSTNDALSDSSDDFAVNPANGLPMIGGAGGVDIEGNPYGLDSSHDGSWDLFASSGLDDFESCSSGMGSDDSWSSCAGDDSVSDW